MEVFREAAIFKRIVADSFFHRFTLELETQTPTWADFHVLTG